MIAFQHTDEETGTITWVPSAQARKTLSALPKELLSQLEKFFGDGFMSLTIIFTAIALRESATDTEQIFRKVLALLAAPTPD